MACSHTSASQTIALLPPMNAPLVCRDTSHCWWCIPRSLARWSLVSQILPRHIRQYHLGCPPRPSRAWGLPQATHPREEPPAVDGQITRNCRQSVPCNWLGADAVRRRRVQRILPWGTPRPVCRTLHHGKRVHRVRSHLGYPTPRGRGLGPPQWKEPGVVGLMVSLLSK